MAIRTGLDNQALKLISALKYDPGYLLLCDLLQAKLDDLTDELANPGLSDDQAKVKLRYWQAFRDILHSLRVSPQNFANVLEDESPESVEESPVSNEVWARLQRQAMEAAVDEQLGL